MMLQSTSRDRPLVRFAVVAAACVIF